MAVVCRCDGLMRNKSVSSPIGYLLVNFFVTWISDAVSTTSTPGLSRKKRMSDPGSVEENTPLI